MIATILALLVAIGLAASPPQAEVAPQAQPETTAAVEAPPAQGTAELPPGSTGLPARAAPPRTMHDQWPVFALFALTWIGIIAYLVVTGREAARLADDLGSWEARR